MTSKEESAACEERSKLVYDQRQHVREDILENDREPEPLPRLELLGHRGDRREAWRIEEVEHQEGECRDC